MHVTTGRWRLGLALALTAALMWGVLPVALKLTLLQMDAVTVTWYRFLVAALLVGGLTARRRPPPLGALDAQGWLLLFVVVAGLCGNYLFFMLGLDYVTPGTAEIVIQLAPLLLLIGALTLFRERFAPMQWAGIGLFVIGMALFFNRRWPDILAGAAAESAGVALVVLSAVVWAAYALAQKQLLRIMSSRQILLLTYVVAAFVFLPAATPGQIAAIDGLVLGMLAFASLNTVIAYGAFAEALNHWEASRVSATVALAPMFTYLTMIVLEQTVPGFALEEPVDVLTLTGAAVVVTGSIMAALGGRRRAAVVAEESAVRAD